MNTQALELSEPTMNITEMTTERYEHPFKFSFCNCYITDWNSMPYLNFTSQFLVCLISENILCMGILLVSPNYSPVLHFLYFL